MSVGKSTITAIVPTYNRSAYLREAINSIVEQSRIVDEIIIWDDGSTDNTETVVRSLSGPVRYFRSDNGGKSRALNAALAHARGDLIWICDDDDIALPDAAETLAGLLEATPRAGLAGGCYKRFQDDPETGQRHFMGPGYWPDLGSGSALRHLLEDIFLFQNATLVRRACYDAVGPFREDLPRSIDYDMIVRLATRFPVALTERPLFHQRKHDGVRGPANAQHAASRSDDIWKAADRQVFEGVRDLLQPALFAGMFDAETPPHAERAGRLQRACVFARRTEWAAALDDFRAAAARMPDTRLSPVERMICVRAMAGKHGCAEALEPDMRRALAALAATSASGAEITAALARGLAWRARAAIRSGDWRQAGRIGIFVTHVLIAGRGRRPRHQPPALVERPDPPLLSDQG